MGFLGAGKTTLAHELTAHLQQGGLQPILLDRDILRNLFKVSGNTIDTHNRESLRGRPDFRKKGILKGVLDVWAMLTDC